MRLTRRQISTAVLVPLALASAFWAGLVMAEAPPSSVPDRAAARELIAVTGAGKQFDTVVPLMLKQLEPIVLQAAPGKEAEVREIMTLMATRFAERKGEMLEVIAGIYAAKLSESDIRTLTQFFSQGAGAAFIAKQPEMLQESMLAGQKWGEKIGLELEQQLRQELTKRGIKI